MTPTQLLARFRSDIADEGSPSLWSDDEIWAYMNDAQSMLCRLTEGLRDATSAATQVAISTGVPWCTLHPSILVVRTAKLVSTNRAVRLFSYEDLVSTDGTSPLWQWTLGDLDRAGPVCAAIIGMEENKLRVVQVPQADDQLQLVIERLPLTPLSQGVRSIAVTAGGSGYTSAPTVVITANTTGAGATATAVLTAGAVSSIVVTDPGAGYTAAPTISFTGGGGTAAAATATVGAPSAFEVRSEHHLALLLWMEHLAYLKQDADAYNANEAAKKENAFYAYCDKAKSEKARRNQKPRLLQYGGL